jgi:hypothetical protein
MITVPIKQILKKGKFFKEERTITWLGLAITAVMLSHHVFTGKLFLIPLYGIVTVVLLIIDRHWRRTPRPVRVIALVSVLTLFVWFVISANAPAHALFFNRLLDILKSATKSWGVDVLDVPNWIAQGMRAIGVVIVAGVLIRLLRSREGEEDETSRSFGKFMKVLIILGLGDAMLSLFNI